MSLADHKVFLFENCYMGGIFFVNSTKNTLNIEVCLKNEGDVNIKK